MIFSLNELDALCKKATRGAGFEWGYAEETGKAIRCLSSFDLPGAKVLANYLLQREQQPSLFSLPEDTDSAMITTPADTSLCPIHTGSYLCDHMTNLVSEEVTFAHLSYPLLLLPYLSWICRAKNITSRFACSDFNVVINGSSIDCQNAAKPDSEYVSAARWILRTDSETDATATIKGHLIDHEVIEILNSFAHRTYVPESELSRQGAGPAE